MANPLPQGISPEEGRTVGTIRHFRCEHCGKPNEVKLTGFVPSDYYNAVVEYCRKAAGEEFVLLSVQTLNAMGEERAEAIYKAVERAMQLDLLHRVFEERNELKQRVRELER